MPRTALTLVEVLIVIGIIGLLIAVLLPAVQQARISAAQATCQNKARQLGLAVHQFAGSHAERLPNWGETVGSGSNARVASMFFVLFPYIEQGNFYDAVATGRRDMGSDHRVEQLLCPLDPSSPPGHEGLSSYAANGQVFKFGSTLQVFKDGSASTIMFGEHFLICRGTFFNWFVETDFRALPPGTPVRPASFAHVPPFAMDDVLPVTRGTPPQTFPSVPGVTFQLRPTDPTCDPRQPQTGHPSGMMVALGDGGARLISAPISETTFWSLVTPGAGDVPDEW
jgi:type II secretory pathway pseudopilin PulG